MIRAAPTPPVRRAPPGRTPPAGYYDYDEPPRRRRSVWPWLLVGRCCCIAGGGRRPGSLYTKIQDQLNANKPVAVPRREGLTRAAGGRQDPRRRA